MDKNAEIVKQLEEAMYAAHKLATALTKLNELGVEQSAELVDELQGLQPDLASAHSVHEKLRRQAAE